jgi:hypothetical protein
MGEQAIISSSGDRSACIWDRRKLGPGVKALHTVTATNVILSAYFSPDGMYPGTSDALTSTLNPVL